MTHFDEEAIAKAKQAKNVEDLLTLAKESGVEMTAEQAQEYYTQFHPKSGELADDQLDNVAGGRMNAIYAIQSVHDELDNVAGGGGAFEYRENFLPEIFHVNA